MDWLRNYEGKRAIGYLILLISSICPTFSAAHLLDNDLDATSNITFLLLLSASLGTMIGIFLSVPTFFILRQIAKDQNIKDPKMIDIDSSLSLGLGFFCSLVIQTAVLIISIAISEDFHAYYISSLIVGLALCGIITMGIIFGPKKSQAHQP